MRVVIDHDVDVAVRSMLVTEGHQAWTASEAGLSMAGDDEISTYAHDKRALVITHDVAFTTRRRKNSFGWHLRLACDEWVAADLLRSHLDEVADVVATRQDVVMVLTSAGKLTVYSPSWE